MAKKKEYPYHVWMSWEHKGSKYVLNTQMYEACGLYVAVTQDGRPHHQFGADPKRFGKGQAKHVIALQDDPDVSNIELGHEMVAFENEQGYWDTKERV